ncbi:hypothetical protein ACFU7T_30885, partial [Streptomyces sp. NPDC057555]|uniref:hypothetical protein n=1 Tax=Streptomyces sp. NPDC057555 TaxID=3346166 RepID=UPI0036ACD170
MGQTSASLITAFLPTPPQHLTTDSIRHKHKRLRFLNQKVQEPELYQKEFGGVLLSHRVPPAVPSALKGLAS